MKLNWSRKDLVEENEEYYNIVTKTLTISLSLSYLIHGDSHVHLSKSF